MLCWKWTEEKYKIFKVADPKKSKEELKTLWTDLKDREVSDIIVPPEEEGKIAIPGLHDTELGVEVKRLSDTVLAASKYLSMGDLKTMTEHFFKLCSENCVEVEQQAEV